MIMMICGELCNFGAYAFVEAIVVTPLGALSVVISAILSHIFLKESLNIFGWIGCIQCILGAILIALNAPSEQSVSTIADFKHLFLAPGFLSYGAVVIAVALAIIFYFAPKYGKKSMLWYISVCSLIGGISVSCTQGLGACILTSIRGDNQFKNWFTYFLLVFVACTLLTEIFYLNVALALFNTAMVTPTYYVMFTFFTLVTSIILYQGLKASASQIITIALAFLVICTGIFVLQMSKTDPRKLSRLGRRATRLLEAARSSEVKPQGAEDVDMEKDEAKLIESTEEPGMDAMAGRFSGVGGTIVRARRRKSISERQRSRSRASTNRSSHSVHSDAVRSDHTLDTNGHANGDVDGLPLSNGNGSPPANAQYFATSSEGLATASPMGTPVGDLGRNPSVHFQEPSGLRGRTTSARSIPRMPSPPAPALISSLNTSRPSLNLPRLPDSPTDSAHGRQLEEKEASDKHDAKRD